MIIRQPCQHHPYVDLLVGIPPESEHCQLHPQEAVNCREEQPTKICSQKPEDKQPAWRKPNVKANERIHGNFEPTPTNALWLTAKLHPGRYKVVWGRYKVVLERHKVVWGYKVVLERYTVVWWGYKVVLERCKVVWGVYKVVLGRYNVVLGLTKPAQLRTHCRLYSFSCSHCTSNSCIVLVHLSVFSSLICHSPNKVSLSRSTRSWTNHSIAVEEYRTIIKYLM